jgi:hypothetical protein
MSEEFKYFNLNLSDTMDGSPFRLPPAPKGELHFGGLKNTPYSSKLFGLFIFLSFFLTNIDLRAQSVGTEQGRIESEFKLAVPPEIREELWTYLQVNFSKEKVAAIDERITTSSSQEIFIDVYFDNDEDILLENLAGVRYRKRYINNDLAKELVQIKLPSGDSSGVARIEQKYDFYKTKKKDDRKAMHPFWKYVRPKDRAAVDEQLAPYRLQGNDMKASIKVQQDRKRIYFQEDGEALLTITLDKVDYFYFPYPTYTEMELELNEVRYTNSDTAERERLEALNTNIKKGLLEAFPMLVQDQTPKYNKMHALVEKSMAAQIYQRLQYIIFGIIVLWALGLFVFRRKINHKGHKEVQNFSS